MSHVNKEVHKKKLPKRGGLHEFVGPDAFKWAITDNSLLQHGTYLISPLVTDCTCFTGGTLPMDLSDPLRQRGRVLQTGWVSWG